MKFANLSQYPKYFSWEFVAGSDFDLNVWLQNEEYDCDSGGERVTFWVVVDNDGKPTFYKCYHEWFWEDGYGSEVINFFELTEVSRDALDKHAKENLRFVV